MTIQFTEEELKEKMKETFLKGQLNALQQIKEEVEPYFKSVDGVFLKHIITSSINQVENQIERKKK
jgi:hypothetical protein